MDIMNELKIEPRSSGHVVESLHDCISRIDHVAVAVRDLSQAVRWYTHALGFRLVERRVTHGERTSMLSAVLVAGAATVVLVQGTSPESQVSRFIEHFDQGVQHIAFGVRDMDEAMRRVTQGGGAAETPVITSPGLRQSFLRRDSGSGVRVELIEARGGRFSDESVAELFRSFEARNLY